MELRVKEEIYIGSGTDGRLAVCSERLKPDGVRSQVITHFQPQYRTAAEWYRLGIRHGINLARTGRKSA